MAKESTAKDDNLLKEDSAARILGVKVKTMQKWRWTGSGPKFVKISGRCVRYRRMDIDEWVDSHLISSAEDIEKGDA